MYIIVAEGEEARFVPSFITALETLEVLKLASPKVEWVIASVLTGLED